METRFLSTDAWRPEGVESDTVSLLLNGSVMIDTGWHPVHNLLRERIAVEDVHTLILTHLHQDHYIGLASILFYWLNGVHDLSGFKIYGPSGVQDIVDAALSYADRTGVFSHIAPPSVSVLAPGDKLQLAGLKLEFAASHHAIPGLMLRCTDEAGHRVVYSGDTSPHRDTETFAAGANVLIHEHSFGAHRPEGDNPYGHSSGTDAAEIARKAEVAQLYLVHAAPALREESCAAAKSIFPHTRIPAAGERIVL